MVYVLLPTGCVVEIGAGTSDLYRLLIYTDVYVPYHTVFDFVIYIQFDFVYTSTLCLITIHLVCGTPLPGCSSFVLAKLWNFYVCYIVYNYILVNLQ